MAFSFSLVYKMWTFGMTFWLMLIIFLWSVQTFLGRILTLLFIALCFLEVNLYFHELLKIKSHVVSSAWNDLSKTFADYHVNA